MAQKKINDLNHWFIPMLIEHDKIARKINNSDKYIELSDIGINDLEIVGFNISYSTMYGVGFMQCELIECKLNHTNLTKSYFKTCKVNRNDFDSSKLHGVRFVDSNLNSSKFNKCNLSNSEYIENEMMYCKFTDCNLHDSNFTNCNLTGSKFINCNLSGTDFNSSNLFGVEFVNCNLEGCKFIGTKLLGTNFIDCKLRNSYFTNRLMRLVDFMRCDLSKVMFDGILLDKCKFIDCQLKTTKFINWCQFINMDSTNFGIDEIKFQEGFIRFVAWRCIQPVNEIIYSAGTDNYTSNLMGLQVHIHSVVNQLKPNSLTNKQSDWDNELVSKSNGTISKHQLRSIGGWAINMHPEGNEIANKTNRFIASYLLLGNELAQLSFNSNELEIVDVLKRYV
jgi:uncharacterized protein YjbI with pentapeptide repeats